MKTLFLTTLATLALAGCAASTTESESAAEALTPQMAADSAELQTYRIRNWSTPDDHTVIVESVDGTKYRAELLGPCTGLNFTTRLAFVNRGGFNQIDRFAGVVLPDGTRCSFRSFNEIVTPATSAKKKIDSSYATRGESGAKES